MMSDGTVMEWTVCVLLVSLATVVAVELKLGDDGVCNGTVDVPVTKTVSYRCRSRNICTKKKTESISRTVPVCCDGWIFHDTKCVPEVKSCDPGLVQLNSTHCGPLCLPGFFNDPHDPTLGCRPLCNQPCVNSNCTGIDECTCLSGYNRTNQFQCDPVCSVCENGTCASPGNCVCNPGYKDERDGRCKPVCSECEHGLCVAPGKCDCIEGYAKTDGDKCKPVCKKCKLGTCVRPDECECRRGYTLRDGECEPVCDEVCQNGECTGHNTCTCATKYILDEANKFNCIPVCSRECTNGVCGANDTCDCISGFERAENRWTCRPICDMKCPNGQCISPNTCKCDLGYEWSIEEKTCKPICTETCVNATCISPDYCKCLEGYDRSNGSSTCKPVCESCFGECVAPNICIFSINCKECEGTCKEEDCACVNGTTCQVMELEAAGVASTPTLAGIQITWMLGAAISLLLLVIITVVIRQIYRRNTYDSKKAQGVDTNTYGSVVYTVPNTLTSPEDRSYQDEDYDDLEPKDLNERGLLEPDNFIERM